MSKRDIPRSYDEIAHDTVPSLPVVDMHAPTTPATERELEALVRERLRADVRLARAAIDVRVLGSEVWLSGAVVGSGVVAYAGDLARGVEGITEVHNELVVSAPR